MRSNIITTSDTQKPLNVLVLSSTRLAFPTWISYGKGQLPPVVQGLRLCADTAGDTGSIPGQGTKIPHALQWVERNQKGKEGTQFFPDTSTLLRPTTKPTRLLSYFLNSVLSGTNTLTDLRWWRKKSQRSAVFLFQVTFAASQKLPRFSMP